MTKLDKPVVRMARVKAPHGVKPEIVVTLFPNGTISLREARRRPEFTLSLAELYVSAMRNALLRSDRRAKALRKEGHGRAAARKMARKEEGLV